MNYVGDFSTGATVRLHFTTHTAAGALVAPSSAFAAADFRIYKDGSATERSSTAGVTVTSPFDSVTGRHLIEIDTSNNTVAGFYAAGSDYRVEINSAKTVDGQTQSGVVIGTFSILNRSIKAGDAMALTSGERTTLAASIWNALTSGITTTGSIGKLIVDNLNSAVGGVAAAVWAVGTRTITGGTITSNSDKSGYALTTAGNNAVAAAVEVELLNDASGGTFLQTLADGVAALFNDAGTDLSVQVIAAATSAKIAADVSTSVNGWDAGSAQIAAYVNGAIFQDIADGDLGNWGFALAEISNRVSAKIADDISAEANNWDGAAATIALSVWNRPRTDAGLSVDTFGYYLDAAISGVSSGGGGGGGDATAANQTAILAAIAALHDFDPSTDSVSLASASIAAIEAALINEGDATALLQAIADKIAAENPSLGDLTLAAIASAVWANGTRTLTAQSDSSGVTTLLTRIGSTLTITGGAVDVTAAGVRAAVGLASANLDTQLATITGRLWTTAELAQLRYVLGIDGTATEPTTGTSHLTVTIRPSIVVDANTPIVTEGLSFSLTAKDDFEDNADITPIGPIRIETDLDLLRVTNPPTLRFGATQRLGSRLSTTTFIDGTAYAEAVAGEPNQFDIYIEVDKAALSKPPGAYSWDVEAVFGASTQDVRTLVDGLLTLKASMGSY